MKRALRNATLAAAVAIASGCASGPMHRVMYGNGPELALSGQNEVPPVRTDASGSAQITVRPDRTVSADVRVHGMHATAAHIHQAAPGANGKVIVPLVKKGDDEFVAPEGARLSEAQYEAYKAGNLYVNVHSPEHKGGEIRAQLPGG